MDNPPPPTQSTVITDQIEVELPDGSRLSVGAELSLAALRRVVSALCG
jgi:hypothetical protein